MRKLLATIALLGVLTLGGCTAPKGDGTLDVVCTIFPEYDWVREITKGVDNVNITLLMDSGVDMHNYKPSAEDIITISNCDVFIYVGGESDGWVEDTLATANNEHMKVVNLLEVVGSSALEEEMKEGMMPTEAEEEEECCDEHVWLSLRNADIICKHLSDLFTELDEDNLNTYAQNFIQYHYELENFDKRYEEVVASGERNTLLFADRFPFRYLTEDYGLDYYAAFMGCSAETEASFETIAFLKGKVEELKLPYVLVIDGSDKSIATTVGENCKILSMNSMQSTTIDSNETYLSIMEDNLKVLSKALS